MAVSKEEAAARMLLARNVRRIRRERDISQEALSEATGTSQGHVSEIEAGKRNVSIDLIGKIGRVLGVPLSSLFDERSEPTKKSK